MCIAASGENSDLRKLMYIAVINYFFLSKIDLLRDTVSNHKKKQKIWTSNMGHLENDKHHKIWDSLRPRATGHSPNGKKYFAAIF